MKQYNVVLQNQVVLEVEGDRIEIEGNFITVWKFQVLVAVFPSSAAVFPKISKEPNDDQVELT